MPLGSKTATTTELWVPVINKSTGEAYKGLEKCSSLEQLEKENKPLSDLLDEKLNAWMDQDQEGNEKKLQDFKQGFKYKHEDGFTYKIVQFKNGEHQLSRSKFGGAGGAGGYRKGGTSYIHLRTVSATIARVEKIPQMINNQADNDNFEIVQLQPDKEGDRFLLLNKKPYTPQLGDDASDNKEAKTESETESEEENSESVE